VLDGATTDQVTALPGSSASNWFSRLHWQAWVGFAIVALLLALPLARMLQNRHVASPKLEVISVPPGATIYLDGAKLPDKTPVLLSSDLRLGSYYQIRVQLYGYEEWSKTLQLVEAKVTEIAVLQPQRVTLHVESNPKGAHVWVNGTLYGTTPLDVVGLPLGKEIEVRASSANHAETTKSFKADADDLNPRLLIVLPPQKN